MYLLNAHLEAVELNFFELYLNFLRIFKVKSSYYPSFAQDKRVFGITYY